MNTNTMKKLLLLIITLILEIGNMSTSYAAADPAEKELLEQAIALSLARPDNAAPENNEVDAEEKDAADDFVMVKENPNLINEEWIQDLTEKKIY